MGFEDVLKHFLGNIKKNFRRIYLNIVEIKDDESEIIVGDYKKNLHLVFFFKKMEILKIIEVIYKNNWIILE